jgi:gliding motility-associated-like protein
MLTSDAACVINPFVLSNGVSIPVNAVPVTDVHIEASADKICLDSLVVFVATPVNGGRRPSYVWTVNGVAVDSGGATYTTGVLKDGDMVGCIMTGDLTCSPPVTSPEVIPMTVYALPTLLLAPDTIIAGGSSIRLNPVVGGAVVDYKWSPIVGLDNPALAGPLATPVLTTTYQLQVTTAEGCRAVASEIVGVFYDVQLPGAFTPNGDGHNDVFRVPPSILVHIRKLAVYNRQGAMLFLTADVGKGWDGRLNGKVQPTGVYVWMIEYDDPLKKSVKFKKGTVILVQ